MISDQALMTTHVETLFTHDVFSRLQFVNEPWADNTVSIPAPRFFLGRTATGNVWRFRSDVPLTLVEQLEELCANEPVMLPLQKFPKYFEEYMRLLEGHQPSQHVWSGPAYHLANPPRLSPSWIPITAANAESLGAGFEKSEQNWRQLSLSLELWRMGALSRFVVVFVSPPEDMKQGLKP